MPSNKISRNAPCPCGSEKKYKNCCYRKAFDWVENEKGEVGRSIPFSAEMKSVLDAQFESFTERHGREPGPGDLVFDEMPPLEHVEHQMLEIMKQAGIDPAIIHAVEKTGRLVTEENKDLLTDAELDEWNLAIEEYGDAQRDVVTPLGTMPATGLLESRHPESEIRKAILHSEEEVCLTALDYYTDHYSTDTTIMPLVIEAVEKYGRDRGFRILRDAEHLVQTEETMAWLIEELRRDYDQQDVRQDN